jgi:protein SCO1
MKKLILVTSLSILFFGCKKHETSLPYFNNPDFTPIWLSKTDPQFNKLHTIPPFIFTDQNGNTITQKNTEGKIYVANFFFTRCNNICPKMTENMHKVANAFVGDNNIVFISHSVTPTYDNVNVLKKYAADKNITNANWHLVTGSQDKIYTIARKGYFADVVSSSAITTQFLHTENFILVDKYRHIRGVYNGTLDVEVANLVEHIKLLKEED